MKCSPLGTLPRYTAAAAAALLICGNVQMDSPLPPPPPPPPPDGPPPCVLLLGTIHTVPGIWLCVYPAICCWYCCCCCISCSHRRFRERSAAAGEVDADGGDTSRPTLPEWKLSRSGDVEEEVAEDGASAAPPNPRPTTRSHASAARAPPPKRGPAKPARRR